MANFLSKQTGRRWGLLPSPLPVPPSASCFLPVTPGWGSDGEVKRTICNSNLGKMDRKQSRKKILKEI